ncbi:19676_t:CDS:1, partial [Rhizophagus irregularis]
MLFLDCFNRVFNLDGITDALWFLGNYFKGVERVAKGLATDWVPWILRPDVGTIEKIKN